MKVEFGKALFLMLEKASIYKYKIQSNNNDIKTEKADPYADVVNIHLKQHL